MLIIPAIDLKDGCVVRYVQGKTGKKVYSRDPLKIARGLENEGAEFLHLVDLDGAFSGIPKNSPMVAEIVKAIDIPVEVGGGIRSIKQIEKFLKIGVKRVVLGTRAIEDAAFLKKCALIFKDKVIISIDAKDGTVMVKGWKESSRGIQAIEFARQLKDAGFKELIYTDTAKDGTLSGPNLPALKELLKQVRIKVVASGGVSGIEDLKELKKLAPYGLSAVIIGKALYEGKFTLNEALKI